MTDDATADESIDAATRAVAVSLGIQPDFIDGRGLRRTVSAQALAKIIAAFADAHDVPFAETAIPATAARAHQPVFDRVWTLAVQLYGLRSARNWGHGDFSDLYDLIAVAAAHGAAGIGLNPLHVLFEDGEDFSPYAPNSRLFLNPLYIDVTAIPGLPDWEPKIAPEALAALRDAPFVDYPGVAAAKRTALREAFARFGTHAIPEARDAFAAFRRDAGPTLRRFACFEVLRRRLKAVWWTWPDRWRTPDDGELAALAQEAADDVYFHEFVQFAAASQLARCRDAACALGMAVGLYLDVAVGVSRGGFDAWNEQDAILPSLSIGAPPDILNVEGQNWGLAGFNPQGLARRDFAPLAAMLHATMRYAGAIRIDHVLGLKRLYMVPEGFSAAQGAYVTMPFAAMLAAVARQSLADTCIVVGEDLGTVPEGFRDAMDDWGLWGYRVILFERDRAGDFIPPDEYARDVLVTFNTHDLPTFAGWMSGHDIALKHALGMDPGETPAERTEAIGLLAKAMAACGIAGDGFAAAARFVAQTRGRLAVIGLEDVLGLVEQPNLPGTVREHPNWLRKMPVAVADLKDHAMFVALAQIMRETGRAAG